MKRTLILAAMFVLHGAFAQNAVQNTLSDVSAAGAVSSNGAMPSGYPREIYVRVVPLGSGTPALGSVTVSWDKAEAVGDGLYHVPGYLPGAPDSETVPARVVQVHCKRAGFTPHLYCDGYSIDPNTTRGENILLEPVVDR
jgi:hypothetical protein